MAVLGSLRGQVLRLWFAAEFGRFISQQPRPDLTRPTIIDGTRPLRVLITGAGLGVSYGTRTAEDALAGQLASTLHATLRRGVQVETQVEIARPLRNTVRHLTKQPALPYDLIVHTPAFGEVHRGHTIGWSRRLRALIDVVRLNGSGTSLVLTGLPAPRVKRPIERIAFERATHVNHVMQRAASAAPLTAFAAAPTYPTPSTYRIFDADYYRQLAASIATAAAPLLAPSSESSSSNPSTF